MLTITPSDRRGRDINLPWQTMGGRIATAQEGRA